MEHSNEVVSGQIKVYGSAAVANRAALILTSRDADVFTVFAALRRRGVVTLFSARFERGHRDGMRNRGELRPIHPAAQDPEAGLSSPCVHVSAMSAVASISPAFTTSGVVSAISADGLTITVEAFSAWRTHWPRDISGAATTTGCHCARGTRLRCSRRFPAEHRRFVTGTAGCQLTYAACQITTTCRAFLGFGFGSANESLHGGDCLNVFLGDAAHLCRNHVISALLARK